MLTEGGHKFAVTIFCERINTLEAVAETLTEKWVDVTVGLEELNRDAERFGRRFAEVNDE